MAIERRSLLSSQARIQAPFIKVTIGAYTFGIYTKETKAATNSSGFYYDANTYNIQYPNYIKSLNISKINGQINQYTLQIVYPVRTMDDPNFFEKVFSSVSSTRKIVFTYGDATMPSYVYKDEEAIITKIGQTFGFGGSGSSSAVIIYTVYATSASALATTGSYTFPGGFIKPSDRIKEIFKAKMYGLSSIFTGMALSNLDLLIEGGDKEVNVETKVNISVLEYITYLVSCMVPCGSTQNNLTKDMYILTLHDDTVYDKLYSDTSSLGGPYFKVSRTSYVSDHSDAYEVDIGINTSTIVTNFQVEQNENFAIYYNYQSDLINEEYVRRLDNKGNWVDVYAPAFTSRNNRLKTRPEDVTWYTQATKYPIKANLTIQGLLRPANLMTYLRLNITFPGESSGGNNRHIMSGLYLVTSQQDNMSEQGYTTTLGLQKISGDDSLKIE